MIDYFLKSLNDKFNITQRLGLKLFASTVIIKGYLA